MTVKEVLLTAAFELGMADGVQAYLDGTSQAGKADTERLLTCYNLVENELALDYLPVTAEDEVLTDTGVVYFTELAKRVVRIVRIVDAWGNETPFTLFPEYVKTQPGKVKIAYTYVPNEKELDGECEHTRYVSAGLMAYGIAAVYSLACGLFEDAAVWDKKYKDAIAAAYRARPKAKITSRRWA